MDINEIWAVCEPWVVALMQTGIGSLLVYLVSRLLVGKWFKRNDINNLVNGFAKKITGSSITVDLTAVAEKKLDKIEKKLGAKVDAITQTIQDLKHLTALVGGALCNSKTLTQEQRAALKTAVDAVESGIACVEKDEPITLRLEPVVILEEIQDNQTHSLINLPR